MTERPDSSGETLSWRERLHARGLRLTEARLAVVEALEAARRPVTHAELSAAVPGLDRVTLYRNLQHLLDAGLVSRTEISHRVWHFELVRGEPPVHGGHAHFVCTRCGDVQCLPAEAVRVQQGIDADAEVQVRGRCAECRAPER